MKRAAVAALGVIAVATTVLSIQYIGRDREYRRLLAAGDEAIRSGDAYTAIEALSGALVLRPDSMAAYFRRAEAYRVQHRQDEAVRDLRMASRLAPDATEPLVVLAELADERGDFAAAAEWYGRAEEKLQAEDSTLLYALALARYRAGHPAAAIGPLQRAIARRHPGGEAHYLLGLAYRDTNHIEDAIASLEEAVRVAPSLLSAREELAELYRVSERPTDEIVQLRSLAALDPNVNRRVALALAEMRSGQFEDALSTVESDSPTGANDSVVQLALGRIHLARAEQTGDRGAARLALAALERALGGTARRSEGLALYGRALFRSGDAAGAERILKEAVATSPVEINAYGYLADAAEQLKHTLDARDALATLDALEGDTASPATRAGRARRLGALSLQGGDAIRAVQYLNDAVGGGDTAPATLGLLAEAHLKTGNPAAARDALNRALEQAPADPALLRLARSIK